MAYKQKEYREKMKRDGSGMEKKKYILLDVGGTEIKGSVSDRNGVRTKIRKFPAQAQKSTEKILDNFAKICRELMREADGSVVGVGMAIPGPFDYENGISRMQGLNKYDAIYGIPLEREIKARVPELGSARFLFLHDIEAFALGESWYGNCRDVDKILCVCIGTGAGSAFVENGKTVKTGKGVPENGWIYQQPFGDSILDDYLSVRGLEQISLAVTGKVWSGKELYGLVKAGNMEAEEVWRRFGADVAAGLLPVLEEYQPDLLLLGLGKGLFFVILCLRKCFWIYPCDFIVPVINKGDNVCFLCTASFKTPKCPSNHLRHQCCGNGGTCQKYRMGLWQVCSLCEDIDVDEYLDFSIAVCFDFTFVVCIGNGDARYHILYFGNDKL